MPKCLKVERAIVRPNLQLTQNKDDGLFVGAVLDRDAWVRGRGPLLQKAGAKGAE